MPETYDGTEGTDAANAGLSVLDGAEKWYRVWRGLNKTRDYIAQATTTLTTAIGAVTKAWTTAADAAAARLALGIPDFAPGNAAQANKAPTYNAGAQLTTADPTLGGHAASKQYVDSAVAGSGGGLADGPTSGAYGRGATGSGLFAVWMNSSLQFMRNTSSIRYKENVRDWDGSVLGLRTTIFDRIDGDPDEVGFIAEEVAEALPEAAVYWEGEIDGINDRVIIAALVADVQRLAGRVRELEDRT